MHHLDDRIYCLKQTFLPDDLQAQLVDADIAYLQNRDSTSALLVSRIERQCAERGISIFLPKYSYGGVFDESSQTDPASIEHATAR